MSILHELKMRLLNRKWRHLNRNNNTYMANEFNMSQVKVGNYTYGRLEVLNDRTDVKLQIGNYCSIAGNVVFMLGLDHPTNHISTFPFKVMVVKTEKREAISKGDIIVEDDVWIGHGAMIMSGVHIGQGAIIAAGAVVTKDVPAYAIVGGVPAKVLKYRFEQPIIEELLKINYEQLTKEDIEKNLDVWYTDVENVNQLKQLMERIRF